MAPYNERRQTVRISTNGNLTVESLAAGPSLRLLDVGMGGFCTRSATAVPVDIVASYRFATSDRKWTAIFRAKAVHSRPETRDGKPTKFFVTGYCFVNSNSPAVQAQLMTLMDHAMNAVSFS